MSAYYNVWYKHWNPYHYRWTLESPQVLVRIERPRSVWAHRRTEGINPRPTFKRSIRGRQRTAERQFVHAHTQGA